MKNVPEVIPVDFETEGILPRPDYPPIPVGCAIQLPGEKAKYLSWGHPTKNNCTKEQAKAELKKVWKDKRPKLFHNAKFDIDVGNVYLDLPILEWRDYHDTLFLIFLQNPDRTTLSLKPVAAEVLNMPAVERDAVREWLINAGVVKKANKKWGAFIARAPGNIVGKYAVGDIVRTRKLFEKYYYEVIVKRDMSEAYDRERRLMPHLLMNERQGMRVDEKRLTEDVDKYTAALEEIDKWISKRLHVKYERKEDGKSWVDSDDELSAAIQNAGAADLTKWRLTPSGDAYSTAKDALEEALTDKPLQAALAYRAPVATCLRTFIRPWSVVANRTHGLVHTNWNQIAQDYHESGQRRGARTGRQSSNPNFQNIPTKLEEKEALQAAFKIMAKVAALRNQLLKFPIPMIRGYVIPFQKGWVLNDRDINQQELRILAHFEDGALRAAYEADPWLDMHNYVMDVVCQLLGLEAGPQMRKSIKTLNFGILYGQGISKTAAKMGTSVEQAKRIQAGHRNGFPGIKELTDGLKDRAKQNLPIRTWGGREYYCEPPMVMKTGPRAGQLQTFEYKLINTLIQGSAADNTKEAIINYCENKKDGTFILSVHDEIMSSVPKKNRIEDMRILQESISACKFDVEMMSNGAWSEKNWNEMKPLPRGK